MNRKVLIISPYFPPSNAADMQRVRMSLPYFKEFGWDAAVVTVDPQYSDAVKDDLLVQSLPGDVKIYYVKAFNKTLTSKIGFGNLALRSLWYYKKKVNSILKHEKYDLIYFSTTQFPVCILGASWKKRFNIPYVIDMQDPWHSDYYIDKPKDQQPKKHWFSYRLHKYLEPIAMKQVDGLISVSDHYIKDLKNRYPGLKDIPSATITFGAFEADLKIAADNRDKFKPLLQPGYKNIVYVGRGGMDMYKAITPLFETLKKEMATQPGLFGKLKLYFIGTSYAPAPEGKPTIMPLAVQYGVEDNVIEITGRISYYHTLLILQQADALFIPGSDDPKYTASKIYPYLLTKKPIMAIFNAGSSAINILEEYGVKQVYSYDETTIDSKISCFFKQVVSGDINEQEYTPEAVKKYSARMMTKRQCDLFNMVNLKP